MKKSGIISSGMVYITVSFNNIIISVTDPQGNVLGVSSSGMKGLRGARKSTPYAGQIVALDAVEKVQGFGLRTVGVVLKGPGPARESALRAIQSVPSLTIVSLHEDSRFPTNGCRPRRKRRV
ncbi:MAG: 30S ribosomal protein S11 [Candidatus Xenolissoclinum pacificiensis L6]|uniref:Small ribosomal subunit protein uS11 n=1 Tax=Candidatus Xenolissoclinum pacificiensis L6 TaxID=1401685 RepID=W2V1J4_9RICK|nr:MAG: 30S ribosomal protein S11 [Candidatus Xenolissoclinum pacificiensis L6]